jgi:hypothetical protein
MAEVRLLPLNHQGQLLLPDDVAQQSCQNRSCLIEAQRGLPQNRIPPHLQVLSLQVDEDL